MTGAAVLKLPFQISGRASQPIHALGLVLFCAASALAQETAAPTPPAVETQVVVQPQQNGDSIEAIIVTGQRTVSSLLNEAARETEGFYARLNEVLDNPDFEITCRNEYPTGSNISRRVCRMRYQEELDSRAALSAMQNLQGISNPDTGEITESVYRGTPYDIMPEARAKMQEFETVLVEAVNTDPELNASVVRLMQLKAAVENYESVRQEERRARRDAEEAAN